MNESISSSYHRYRDIRLQEEIYFYFFLNHALYSDLTSKAVCNDINEALRAGQEKHFEILYYKKNGEFNLN